MPLARFAPLALVFAACWSSHDRPSDGDPIRDAGPIRRDAGPPRRDAGPRRRDAGPPGRDAGVRDAGPPDDAGCRPDCPPPPPGCEYVTFDPCVCGLLSCEGCGGETCGPGEYCDVLAPLACAGPAMCRRRPAMCTRGDPVCGCDGAEYRSECDAHRAGTDVAGEPPCDSSRDCRVVGCVVGLRCSECADGAFRCTDPTVPEC